MCYETAVISKVSKVMENEEVSHHLTDFMIKYRKVLQLHSINALVKHERLCYIRIATSEIINTERTQDVSPVC